MSSLVRNALRGALILAVLGAISVVAPGGVAHAAKRCVAPAYNGASWYSTPSPYSKSLHGHMVYLQTAQIGVDFDRDHGGAARAYMPSGFRKGDILSIDRSIATITTAKHPTGRNWLTSDIQARGGWDYCEGGPQAGTTAYTYQVDGVKNAVRVCLRRNGALQCTNDWWVDLNG